MLKFLRGKVIRKSVSPRRLLYPGVWEMTKNPAEIAGMRYKDEKLMSRVQKTDGTSRCFAQIENIKRQSLVNTSLMVQTLMPFLVVISYWIIVHISFHEILEINFHLVL